MEGERGRCELAVIVQRSILAVIFQIIILKLGIPARFRELERLRDEFGPVLDGGSQVAGVHDVKFLGEGPRFLAVVDFELHVGGDPTAARKHFGHLFLSSLREAIRY